MQQVLPSMSASVFCAGSPLGVLPTDQLDTCTSQWTELVHGMGSAMSSVTKLRLRATFEQLGNSSAKPRPARASTFAQCRDSCALLTHATCKLLAPALPALQELCIDGCCESVAFAAFGASCPYLTHLKIDPNTWPATALRGLERYLPILSCLTIKTRKMYLGASNLAAYVGSALCAVQDVTSLVKLVVEIDESNFLRCEPGCWEQVPSNLEELVLLCEVRGIQHVLPLFHSLKNLTWTSTTCCLGVCEVIRITPSLRRLSITGPRETFMYCDEGDHEQIMTGLRLLKERMLDGLQLSVPAIRFEGSSLLAEAALPELPALPIVTTLALRYKDGDAAVCLSEIARVFPNLVELKLFTFNAGWRVPLMGFEQLACLVASTSLKRLEVSFGFRYTPSQEAALEALASAMPGLVIAYEW